MIERGTEVWEFEDRDWELDDHDWSPKAWMSVRDADLFEAILLAQARTSGRMEVLEWGSGRSTLYYSGLLAQAGLPFRWLSIEYDREFFHSDLEPQLDRLAHPRTYLVTDEDASRLRLPEGPQAFQTVEIVVFDKGRLRPMLRAHPQDRLVNMDAYVAIPAAQGRRFGLVLVDGRKRRRCLREASTLLTDNGVALLHDAWRPYYHCGFQHFESGRLIGDILWIGAQTPQFELNRFLDTLSDA